ncbi:tRNA (5-methylaminomethyl-2-thiouridine)(34)-methyltransferase MnmD [Croceiramulus getboli]|nr:tRNA (5-methylaminomethyl-2-thiouridine)(34)-methyltransferase MnmD [Flavobacteriaceae bacterium YJPT1-3]
MKRKIVTTGDGSTTIQLTEWNEQYHSMHGAVQEAEHVFVKMGLEHRMLIPDLPSPLNILEMGLGTGLNVLVTLQKHRELHHPIAYTGIEAYPVSKEEWQQLNYLDQMNAAGLKEAFVHLHQAPWEASFTLQPGFTMIKLQQRFEQLRTVEHFDLIYFDAFGARVQPELWTVEIFQNLYQMTNVQGVLVTYSAKGSVRRALQEVGYTVERLQGPPGKREMLRATKSA